MDNAFFSSCVRCDTTGFGCHVRLPFVMKELLWLRLWTGERSVSLTRVEFQEKSVNRVTGRRRCCGWWLAIPHSWSECSSAERLAPTHPSTPTHTTTHNFFVAHAEQD